MSSALRNIDLMGVANSLDPGETQSGYELFTSFKNNSIIFENYSLPFQFGCKVNLFQYCKDMDLELIKRLRKYERISMGKTDRQTDRRRMGVYIGRQADRQGVYYRVYLYRWRTMVLLI